MTQAVTYLETYDTRKRHTATVTASVRITPEESDDEVRELTLDIDRDDFPYEVGQSVGVLAPGNPELGQQHHFRLYSVADLPERNDVGQPRIKLCVRRCTYIDSFSGERFDGVASNFLCDLRPGEAMTLTGPYGLPFQLPDETDLNLILIGVGTGIAPFRAFVKHIYRHERHLVRRVWLFYGARTGLEMLYMNNKNADLARYYDEETFRAFKALSPRPHWAEPIAWDDAMAERGAELWSLFGDPKTHIFVAGLEPLRGALDRVFAQLAGGMPRWQRRKAELTAAGRWVELLY